MKENVTNAFVVIIIDVNFPFESLYRGILLNLEGVNVNFNKTQ